jgi:hypothetical protein
MASSVRPLTTQEHLDIAKAKARGSFFVLHHDSAHALVFEQCQERALD